MLESSQESTDLSSIQWQDSDNSQDPFIWVDGDVCLSADPEGTQRPRHPILNTAEGSYVTTEVTAGSSQPPSALLRTDPVDRSLPSDTPSQPTSSAANTKISAKLTRVFQNKTLDNTELPATQKHGDSTRISLALWQMIKSKPAVCVNLSSVSQGSATKRTPEGVGQTSNSLRRMIQRGREAGSLSAPLQRLVHMVENVFHTGPTTKPWGTPSRPTARTRTTPAAASRGPTPLSLPTDPFPAQASARLSALFSRQRVPGGPTAHTHPTHTAKMGERSRANPYIVTQPSNTGKQIGDLVPSLHLSLLTQG